MSNERTRDRGNLFENTQKKKPSQPDFHGDCVLGGVSYEIRGWRRDDQLTVSLAPPRGDRNTYPPDAYRGALDAAPVRPAARNNARGGDEAVVSPAWTGQIESPEAAYALRAFEKQGKSGRYFTLSFEPVDLAAQAAAELVSTDA